ANGVIPVQTRTPIVYGQAAATLGHLAPGRFALGLGLSSEIIIGQWHGLPFAPSIQQMREAVQIIRMAASGERVNFDGKFYRLKNFRLAIPAASPAPRIYLAALGPKMCELAGEVADGVLLNWLPPSAMPASVAHVETGAKRAGRSLPDIDVAVYVRTCVTDEPAAVRETLARDITGYAIVSVYARFFAECGFAEEVEAVNAAWTAGDRAGAVKGISERVLDGLGAVGSAEACREQMNAFARTGATPVVLPFAPPGPDARASMLRTFRSFP
ncbi:MAG TPA: LLM class flavin-dependent oxidoreductase, partial [Candidatus Acidoferrales bacterium]|nr:LLM class flavin-dependent oxidoreductase [Candidatus Acidoferrales bacterium]